MSSPWSRHSGFVVKRRKVWRLLLASCGFVAGVFVTELFADEAAQKNPSDPLTTDNELGVEQTSLNFFEQDAAKSVFGPEVNVISAGKLALMRSRDVEKKEEAAAIGVKAAEVAKAKDGAPAFDPDNTKPEDIIAQFGDPAKEVPVLAVETAPTPFKAMMRALESKNDDLAYKYARQYVRYLGRLQARNQRVMSLSAVAIQREGMDESGVWGQMPAMAEDKDAMERDLQASGIADSDPELQDRTRDLLQKAKNAEFKAEMVPEVRGQGAMSSDRAALKAAAANRPAAPKSVRPAGMPLVDVYFFFKPDDRNSEVMAAEVEKLYRSGKNINLIGVTVTEPQSGMVRVFREKTRISFPAENGARLAEALGVTEAPAVLVVNSGNNASRMMVGIRPVKEIEGVVKQVGAEMVAPRSGGEGRR